jgi:hypothetical protein
MRRRLITLATAALLAVGGFAAAAVASGGDPLGILDDQGTSTVESSVQTSTIQTSTEQESTEQESTDEESTEVEETSKQTTTEIEAQPTTTAAAEQKVTICHHTGSAKHPFHEISVDEHAVDAHTGHGDTLGACPAAPPAATTAAHHGKGPKQASHQEPHAAHSGEHDGGHVSHGNGRNAGGHGSRHGGK